MRQKFNSICAALAEFEISFGNEYSSTYEYNEDPCRYLSQHLSICYVQADFKSIFLLLCVCRGQGRISKLLHTFLHHLHNSSKRCKSVSSLSSHFSLYLCLCTIPLRKFKTGNSIESLSCPEASGQGTVDSGQWTVDSGQRQAAA